MGICGVRKASDMVTTLQFNTVVVHVLAGTLNLDFKLDP
jgi:hypothetical protein